MASKMQSVLNKDIKGQLSVSNCSKPTSLEMLGNIDTTSKDTWSNGVFLCPAGL